MIAPIMLLCGTTTSTAECFPLLYIQRPYMRTQHISGKIFNMHTQHIKGTGDASRFHRESTQKTVGQAIYIHRLCPKIDLQFHGLVVNKAVWELVRFQWRGFSRRPVLRKRHEGARQGELQEAVKAFQGHETFHASGVVLGGVREHLDGKN